MTGLTSQPNLGSIVEALRFGPRDPGLDPAKLRIDLAPTGSRCARSTRPSRATSAPAPPRCTCTTCPAASTRICASRRARSGIDEHALARGGARLRRGQRHVRRHHQGDADLEGGRRHGAVHGDQRPDAARQVLDRHASSRSPSRWWSCFAASSASRRRLSRRRCSSKVLKGAQAAHARARASCCRRRTSPPSAPRIQPKLPRPVTDEDLASYLMYPRVFADYAADRAAVRRRRRSCRRRCSSTAWSPGRRSASTSSAARR